jgi:molybdate transport system substrate-binding protein
MSTVSLFSALAVRGALEDVVLPAYSGATGVLVDRTFDPTTVLLRRIEEGARPDVMVGVSASLDSLVTSGFIDGSSRTPIARSRLGIATARGGVPPDIGTVDALIGTLLGARSVAYSRTGASGIYFARMIEELGIAAQVNARATILEKGFTAQAVVDGRADIAVQQLSELRFVREAEIVGPLPDAVQQHTDFSAALGASATDNPDAAELIRYLAGGSARAAYVRFGLETV